jgi:hypothetical protein
MTIQSPNLSTVIQRYTDDSSRALRVAMPGEIVDFDSAKQTATVKPLLLEVYIDASGARATEVLPQLVSVPVQIMAGITAPIRPGDGCLVIFCDRSLDGWLDTGTDKDSGDVRAHTLTDAVCIVGLRSANKALTEYDGNAVQVGQVGGPRIRLDANAINIGVSHASVATDAAVLGTTYRAAEDAFFSGLVSKLVALGTGLVTAGATPPLTPLGALGTALQSIASDLATFNSTKAAYLSGVVKIK